MKKNFFQSSQGYTKALLKKKQGRLFGSNYNEIKVKMALMTSKHANK